MFNLGKLEKTINQYRGRVGLYYEDLDTGELFTKNPEGIFPSASTIKVLIIAALFQAEAEGIVNLEDKLVIKPQNRVGGSGVLSLLDLELQLTVQDIATLMIVVSDNAATNELIDLVGQEKINRFSKDIGLQDTVLQRKMMDLKAAKAGRDNVTSAKDMGHLLKMLAEGRLVSKEASTEILEIMKSQQFTNKLPFLLPAKVSIAHKTGELDLLQHDMGIFFLPSSTYILVVLTNELVSNVDGVKIISEISRLVYDSYAKGS